jgi:hypothetical protein
MMMVVIVILCHSHSYEAKKLITSVGFRDPGMSASSGNA